MYIRWAELPCEFNIDCWMHIVLNMPYSLKNAFTVSQRKWKLKNYVELRLNDYRGCTPIFGHLHSVRPDMRYRYLLRIEENPKLFFSYDGCPWMFKEKTPWAYKNMVSSVYMYLHMNVCNLAGRHHFISRLLCLIFYSIAFLSCPYHSSLQYFRLSVYNFIIHRNNSK